jgi:hypothetical protein
MVFARRWSRIQQAIVEIDDASSGFLQFVVMALRGDQRGQLVHPSTRLVARFCGVER